MFKIAWRNILRNKRRSLLSLLIMVSSVAILFLVLGYIGTLYWALDTTSVAQTGHFQIAKPSYWDIANEEPHLLEPELVQQITDLLNENREVSTYNPELGVNGIMGNMEKSTIISGRGIEPGNQQSQNILIKMGTNLYPGDELRILVGDGVRRSLNLNEDDWVSIVSTTPDGSYNAASIQISGSYTTGYEDYDGYMVFVPITFAQQLLNTDGVDKIVVNLRETDKTEEVVKWFRSKFAEANLDLQIKTWIDLNAFFTDLKNWYDMIFFFLSTVIFILVFLGVMEIMTMSFFERMNEIGTMRAIGTLRGQVFTMLIQEALILGFLGIVVGLLCGWGLGYFINSMNITYFPPGSTMEVPLTIDLSMSYGIIPLVIILVATILSALYPATKSSRLNIVEVLRHI